MKSIREFWELLSNYLGTQKKRMTGLAIVLGCSISFQLITPLILRDFIDIALAGGNYRILAQKALIFFVLVFLTQAAATLATYISEQVAWLATNSLRVDLAKHCLRLDMIFHQSNPPGALIERIDGDVDALSNFFSRFVVTIIANCLLVVGVLIMLYREDWRVGVSLTLFALLAILVIISARKTGADRWVAFRQKNAEAFGYLGEILHGTEDIRSSGATDHMLYRFDQILRSWLPVRRESYMAFNIVWVASLLLFALGTGLSFSVGYALWSIRAISVGTVYLIFNYTELIRLPIEQIRVQIQDLQRASASIARVRELLTLQPKVQDGPGVIFPEGALDVEFRNVTFSYGDHETALKDIGFRLPAGKTLGLLGRTGSGKSTLARLLLRLYDPSSGQIYLGNVSTQLAKLTDLSAKVGLVPQEVQIFQATVRDNFTMFDPSINDQAILRVIDEFELSGWFQTLPNGLDTELSQAGLSAGQAQLINFARVALRSPSLVILDEATSRLDLATEALIDRVTERLLCNRTSIVIAHRLHTIKKADLIMILENGSIVEYAERQNLIKNPNSRFSALLQTGLEEVLR